MYLTCFLCLYVNVEFICRVLVFGIALEESHLMYFSHIQDSSLIFELEFLDFKL
ncbi:hypothetical protein Lalb_Chr25g0282591 [Lupinus albus]|uniref:Uncharacterized protein n=1 Tax=Lupinus albus TaxID=3870 RepID=A0A6A4N3V1_LUPAL|nr:hypothetical protein Lalb_Chr25g0282591 [Lupinus albus]